MGSLKKMDSVERDLKNDSPILYVNGIRRVLPHDLAHFTLLEYLRDVGLTGTKLGCGEGGCGACTVMVSHYDTNLRKTLHYAINACLAPLYSVEGMHVITVEGLGSCRLGLHPIQESLARTHGSQCGFCTPGFVMSMYALLRSSQTPPSEEQIEECLAGNLCRCTGYRAILDAFRVFAKTNNMLYTGVSSTSLQEGQSVCPSTGKPCSCNLDSVNDKCVESVDRHKPTSYNEVDGTKYTEKELIFPPELLLRKPTFLNLTGFGGLMWYRPLTLNNVLDLKAKYPDAKLLVGNTEVGIEMRLKRMQYQVLVSVMHVPELNVLEATDDGIEIGAAVRLSILLNFFRKVVTERAAHETSSCKAFIEQLKWFAGSQIRNVSSIGGNICTASPISDLNPLWMAARAKFRIIDSKGNIKTVLAENFFLGYRKVDLASDEILLSVFLPWNRTFEFVKEFKQSHRRDDDIAIVNAGIRVHLKEHSENWVVADASIVYGGVAPCSLSAIKTKEFLIGKIWDQDMLQNALKILQKDIILKEDAPGGMVEFRKSLTLSFFFKFFLWVSHQMDGIKESIPISHLSAVHSVHRPPATGSQDYEIMKHGTSVGSPEVHQSSRLQVTGEALYADDTPMPPNGLHAALVLSRKPHARILSIDDSVARSSPGFVGLFLAKDIPGDNMIGAVVADEELFAVEYITCVGQTAIKMYKLAGEEKYLLWSVCSIHLQVLCGNGGDKLLVLAEGLLKKHVASHSLHEPEALMVYISILEQQLKFGDALEILSGKLGSLLTINVDKLRMQGRLLALAGDYTAAADIFQKILEQCPDDWEGFLHYLGCLLEDGSIWGDEAVNDPVHPPKFVSCKVSHLTDEQFDSRISIASAFIRKLQTDTVDNSVRGPYLATIEIERRRHLRGKGNDNNLMDGIVQYFCRFGHLGCFASDVEMFFEVFTTDKKAELSEKLTKINDTLSTPPTKTLGLSISLFKIKQQLLLGDMFNSSANDVEVSCVQMFEMYCKNIPLSKDLDPQESMHGEELLSITCNILVQLFWRTKNVGYLVEAVMVLEFGLSIRRYVSQYKILLLHLYCHFGALSVAHEWYKSLDVKNILMESMLHHILPQMLVSPLWTELNNLLKDYLKFMDDHFRESADLTFLAYHHKNYSKIIEFVQFKDRLQRSSQYLVTRVETPILQLKQNADNIEDEEGILQSMKCGIDFLELSNEIGSKSLTFNENLESRPWWTPTVEKNYLLGPFQGISYCPKEILTKERETSLKREIEKKSLLPRMIYLSIQSASLSIKEHVAVNGSVKPDITLELKLLLERFSQFLGFSLSEAIEVVKGGFSNGERSVVSDSNLIDWLNFTVFLNAWNLSSHELVHPNKNEGRPIIWNILDSLLERYILEKVRSMEPQLCSPCSDVQLLMQLVTEPLAWHGLVIQSCLRSCLPSSKKKKKNGPAYQSSSNLAHAITDSVQQLSLVLEGVMERISEWNRRPEDDNSEGILSLLREDEHNDGPGRVFHVLETFISSMSNAEVGDRIYHSLKSWSPADVARKIMSGKLKVLTEFSAICESKLKLLQSLKQQIAQV